MSDPAAGIPPPRRALFGLGANLGDRWRAIGGAVASLVALGGEGRCSAVFETAPVGGPAGQAPYLNCVVAVTTALSPDELLAEAQRLEREAGRERAERWGSRTLDVDLLWVDGYRCDDEALTVPHPRMFERAFVLAPLEEVAPDVAGPGWRARLGGRAVLDAAVTRVGAILAPG